MAIGARVVTAEGRKIQVGPCKWYLGFSKNQVGLVKWYLGFSIWGKIQVGLVRWYLGEDSGGTVQVVLLRSTFSENSEKYKSFLSALSNQIVKNNWKQIRNGQSEVNLSSSTRWSTMMGTSCGSPLRGGSRPCTRPPSRESRT